MSDDAAKKEAKERKVLGFVLVAVPGWPARDPGRQMVFRVYPTELKAQRKAKRLGKRMPEYLWEGRGMTLGEARLLRLKPFRLEELGLEVRPTARGAQVVTLPSGHDEDAAAHSPPDGRPDPA